MLISDFLDLNVLDDLITNRYITRKFHKDYPNLAILNYSPAATYDSKLDWGPEMNNSRGLIYDIETGKVVARPYKKFWNLNDPRHPETLEENLPDEIPLIADKLDGSMGTIFKYDSLLHVATRGSFHSDQANWATKWLREHYPDLDLPKDATVITEIIYAANKIVVSYDWQGLMVTGIVGHNGVEWSRTDVESWIDVVGMMLVKKFSKSLVECSKDNIKNTEGYVLTYSNGLKVKIKMSEYVRLHRILTGLNPKDIWELLAMKQESTIQEWLDDSTLPSEFKTWLNRWARKLQDDFDRIDIMSRAIFDNRPGTNDRKVLAAYFLQPENKSYSSLCFGLLDHYDTNPMIWKLIKPAFNDTFKVEGE